MADQNSKQKGGIHFGAVGGSVTLSAGGDIVGGDKTTTITKGFSDEGQKQQFQSQLEHLREELRTVKEKIRSSSELGVEEREAAEGEILRHVSALRDLKEKTADLPAGKSAPAEIAAVVESTLERVGGIVDGLQRVAKKSLGIAESVGEFALKFGPLLASARHLFGLP